MLFYDFKYGLTPKQRIDRLDLLFGDKAPPKSQRGSTTFSDEYHEGSPTFVLAVNVDVVK